MLSNLRHVFYVEVLLKITEHILKFRRIKKHFKKGLVTDLRFFYNFSKKATLKSLNDLNPRRPKIFVREVRILYTVSGRL